MTRVAVGDRVLGCFHVACGSCTARLLGDYHRCERGRTFGHGSTLGSLPGTQADQALVPFADMVLFCARCRRGCRRRRRSLPAT